MHAGHVSRYSLLAVVGAGFFVSAPIATWLVVDSMTAPSATNALVALDVPASNEGNVDSDVLATLTDPEAVSSLAHLDDVERGMANLHSLAQDARIVPAFENGRVIGFKLFSIRPDSDFARAGLQNGDVVTRINGIELSSPERALEAYQRANDGLIVVDFLRRGERGTLTHHIPPPALSPSQQP